jgi:capsular exopolysaccharide synthesis family protein
MPPHLLEEYRKLAATLHHAQQDRGIKIVMIASAVPNEGKTLTASNLALTLSESYRRRVLLIDADLRHPSLHEAFQVPSITGLSDGLRSSEETRLNLVQLSPSLTLLPGGRPDHDPMSILSGPRMKKVLGEAAENFDWVIVDTPPVGLLPDANLLAAMVDGALLVVRANQTPFAAVKRAVDTLGRDKVLGVVMNAVNMGRPPHAYGYDYYHYTNSGGRS